MTRRLLTIALAFCWLGASRGRDPVVISIPLHPHHEPRLEASSEYTDCPGMQGLSVNIRDAGLRHVHSDFVNSSSVTRLDISSNDIVDVSPGAFRLLPNLLHLNLSSNRLSVADFARLEAHPRLCALHLDGNNASASVDFAARFPELRRLHLRDNGIGSLASLSFAPKLERLYLSANRLGDGGELTFLEDAPRTLRTLDLADNGIRRLKLGGAAASLRELILNGNRLENLCGGSCDGEAVLQELKGAVELRRLLLSRNALSRIEPGAFSGAESLLELDLSHNRLESIPEGAFEPLQELETLSLRGNLFEEVPYLCGPDSLLHLSLAENRIEVVGNDSFCVMEKLRIVDLSRNRIRSVDPEAFEMRFLEVLDLSYNRLKRLADYWLKPLGRLKTLIVDGNQFESVKDLQLDKFYAGYSKLENVYLRNNSIVKVDLKNLYNVLKRNPHLTIELFSSESANGSSSEGEVAECKCDCDNNEV